MGTPNRYRFPLLLLLATLALSVFLNGYLLVEGPDAGYQTAVAAQSVPEIPADTTVHAELARVRQQLVECRGGRLATTDSLSTSFLSNNQP